MQGVIQQLNEVDKKGVIEYNTSDCILFYFSNISFGKPFIGAKVKFKIKFQGKDKKIARDIHISPTSPISNNDEFNPYIFNGLKEISLWKLEAKLEDNHRYFFPIPAIEKIEKGSKYFIIGRKGSGKTAISEYFKNKTDYNTFSTKLSFKNFPFNTLYELKDDTYTYPNIYITLWKFIIFSSIAKMMCLNQNIESNLRSKLSSLYSEDINLSLRNTISRWTNRNFRLSILGNSADFSGSKSFLNNDTTWVERVNILENCIKCNIDDSRYYIIFDELDEDYSDLSDINNFRRYTSLLIGLFKAVQDIKSDFPYDKFNILPIIFLRDDIYSRLMDSDKTKWLDYIINLEWDNTLIQQLLAFRISRSLSPAEKTQEFDFIWHQMIPLEYIPGFKNVKRTPFEFITMMTLRRPRDYVQFLKLTAEYCVNSNSSLIKSSSIMYAASRYSNYLKSEFQDEIYPLIPDISLIFNIFSDIKKQSLPTKEFINKYREFSQEHEITVKDPIIILKTLFDFSVIGNNIESSSRYIFKYNEPHAIFNPNRSISIHYGLWKSLLLT